MKIISASQLVNGKWIPIPECQIKEDLDTLFKMNIEAKKQHPTWEFFGGTLTIENRKYQVA